MGEDIRVSGGNPGVFIWLLRIRSLLLSKKSLSDIMLLKCWRQQSDKKSEIRFPWSCKRIIFLLASCFFLSHLCLKVSSLSSSQFLIFYRVPLFASCVTFFKPISSEFFRFWKPCLDSFLCMTCSSSSNTWHCNKHFFRWGFWFELNFTIYTFIKKRLKNDLKIVPSNVNRAESDLSTHHWTTEKYEVKYRRKDEGQQHQLVQQHQQKKMHNKGEGGKKINGILSRGRAIRDENKQLPLISPDRN